MVKADIRRSAVLEAVEDTNHNLEIPEEVVILATTGAYTLDSFVEALEKTGSKLPLQHLGL